MGDNDTRADAKRLALLDAKRLALEQAGTYIEGISEVKNLDLAKEEIWAVDFPDFCGHLYARFDTASNASGRTPLRWLCRRMRL